MSTRSHTVTRIEPLLLISVGGFVGASLRYAISTVLPAGFPWGTLTVNAFGSFALGLLLYEAHLVELLSVETRLVLGTGLLSSFTTYSTFAVETATLEPTLAVANVGANYLLGFLAVIAARVVTRGALL
jgi:CrcB protein